ncbi:MAG: nucleotidyltransferase family protein, partial [Lachnospiraceae bacterium]
LDVVNECKGNNKILIYNDGGTDIAVQIGNNEVEYVEYHGRKAVIEYARMQYRLKGIDANPKACYHHIETPAMDGTEVEMHYRPAFLRSPLRNWRMQRWFENHADDCMKNKTHLGFSMMTSSVNVVYQMCHLYTHIFEGGFGLRQLMDYYFALRVWHNDVMECKDLQSQGMWSEGLGTPVMSKEEVMAVLRSFGMGKFAAAVMWVLNEVFGGNNENDNENEKCPQMNTDGHGCPQADVVGERECPRISRELKENIINPQITQMNTDGCPQADEDGERELPRISRELKGIGPQADFEGEQQLTEIGQQLKEIGPQADERSEREFSRINREFKKNNDCPWLLCEPNEKEGRKLLAEIMQGGNFGQYDTRDAALKKGGMIKHGIWKLKRVMRLVRSYPEEALWEPVFRVYHLFWRIWHR